MGIRSGSRWEDNMAPPYRYSAPAEPLFQFIDQTIDMELAREAEQLRHPFENLLPSN